VEEGVAAEETDEVAIDKDEEDNEGVE